MPRSYKTGIGILILSMLIAGQAGAKTRYLISGQVRARTEYDARSFSPDIKSRNYSLLRTRLAVDALVHENARIYLQLQDSRTFGGYTYDNLPASGGLNDGKNVDMHQAFVQIDRLWMDHLGFKAGRFELNFGNQRVFGAVDWNNVGRSWDGAQLFYDFDDFTVTGFYLKKLEKDAEDGNRDFDIGGVYTRLPEIDLDLFAFYEFDANVTRVAGVRDLKRWNVGTYYRRDCCRFDIELNGVYQFGKKAGSVESGYDRLDISAYMFTLEVGCKFEGNADARIAVGIDYTSGDDDENDDKIETYDNLYYTAHKFRGYMDYFVTSPEYGLVDVMLRGKLEPFPQWKVRSDIHYFTGAAEYRDFRDETTRDVGMEIDLVVSTTSIDGVIFDFGGGLFLPTESFAGMMDPDPGLWLYASLTADF